MVDIYIGFYFDFEAAKPLELGTTTYIKSWDSDLPDDLVAAGVDKGLSTVITGMIAHLSSQKTAGMLPSKQEKVIG